MNAPTATVVGAVIAAVASVLVAVMTTWPDDLQQLILGPPADQALLGEWRGEWHINQGEYDGPTPVRDIVRINKVIGDRIEGEGIDPRLGGYTLIGRDADVAIAAYFHGTGDKRNLQGVALLEKRSVKNHLVLVGKWLQLQNSGGLVGGEVTLSRQGPLP